jgi:hypothetical protein
MPLIYRQCARLRVWLGEASEHSNHALHPLSQIAAGIDFHLDEAEYGAINEPFTRPWWNRIWVVQELQLGAGQLSQSAIFICGDETISIDELRRATARLQSPASLYRFPQSMFDSVNALLVVRSARSLDAGPKTLLATLLALHRERKASDPRDKVYALLGLSSVSHEDRFDVRPNYSKTYDRLLQDAAWHLAWKSGTHEMLRQCQLRCISNESNEDKAKASKYFHDVARHILGASDGRTEPRVLATQPRAQLSLKMTVRRTRCWKCCRCSLRKE